MFSSNGPESEIAQRREELREAVKVGREDMNEEQIRKAVVFARGKARQQIREADIPGTLDWQTIANLFENSQG